MSQDVDIGPTFYVRDWSLITGGATKREGGAREV